MRALLAFAASTEGAKAFAQLKRDNEAEFPEYVDEMRGLAQGAGVMLDEIWCCNLLNELGNLMATRSARAGEAGCSDLYAVAPSGYGAGFAEGHNTDWSEAVKPFVYFASLEYGGGAPVGTPRPFESCAGLGYPGHVIGSPPTWSRRGVYATQNSLAPRRSRPGGLAGAFVQRRATCGAAGLDEVVEGLARPGWSDGASVNVVDLHGRRMANVEVWEDRHSVQEVTAAMGNYSHFNQYKHLTTASGRPIDDPRSFQRDRRQALVDSRAPVRTEAGVEALLSDPDIFSASSTVISMVLNGTTGVLKVWCCGQPPARSSPVYTWNLLDFF